MNMLGTQCSTHNGFKNFKVDPTVLQYMHVLAEEFFEYIITCVHTTADRICSWDQTHSLVFLHVQKQSCFVSLGVISPIPVSTLKMLHTYCQ